MQGPLLHIATPVALRLLTAACDQDITNSLNMLGTAAGVDRVIVFKGHDDDGDTPRASLCYEWAASGLSRHIDDPRLCNIDLIQAGYGDVLPRWERRETLCVHPQDVPPGKMTVRDMMQVKSALQVPIFTCNGLYGVLSILTTRKERDWSWHEIMAFQTVADMLGICMERGYEARLPAQIAYELCGPITNLKLYLYLLTHHPEKHDTYATAISEQVQKLEALLDRLHRMAI